MNNSGKVFSDEITKWLIKAGFVKYQFQMSIYYKYAPDGKHIFVLKYVHDYVNWHTSESLVK